MNNKITWTPEIMDAFETLLGREENLTYLEIARRLSDQFGLAFTKNSCIGQAYRMRLPPRPPKTRIKARKRLSRKVITMPVRIDAPIPPKEALRYANGDELTLIQLEHGLCRWTGVDLDTNPPYTYCGKPTLGGASYCPGHYVRVYHPAKKTFA